MLTKTRIYVCGSQSVGKTTLCRELGKHLGYEVVTEAARDIMNADKISFADMQHNVAARNSFQNRVTTTHLNKHYDKLIEVENEPEVGVVFDRGIDFLVYAAAFSTVANDHFKHPNTQNYIDTLKKPESLVVLLEPHEKLLKQDDVRAELNMKSAYEITFGIKVLLEIFGIPYLHITTCDIMERVKLVSNIIKQRGVAKLD